MEAESVSDLGPGPSASNGVEALQLLEHEQGLGLGLLPNHCPDYLKREKLLDKVFLTKMFISCGSKECLKGMIACRGKNTLHCQKFCFLKVDIKSLHTLVKITVFVMYKM